MAAEVHIGNLNPSPSHMFTLLRVVTREDAKLRSRKFKVLSTLNKLSSEQPPILAPCIQFTSGDPCISTRLY
jgi:hypothetical protein